MKAILSFYSDALKIALQSIFAHKLRAFLTLFVVMQITGRVRWAERFSANTASQPAPADLS